MKTQQVSRNQFAIIDEARQMVVVTALVSGTFVPLSARLTREIRFAEIESVYLDMQEDSRMVPDQPEGDYGGGSTQHLESRRRWVIGVHLKSGETVCLYDEVTERPAQIISDVSLQRSYWESLATHVSGLLDKPLLQMAPAPSAPRTFIEAIDQILQRRLAESPLANRSVQVRGRGLGVEIWVDSRMFERLDEVNDRDARDLIQSAIDEWQSGVA